MNCKNCKKSIVRPLELFNGKLACPHCGEVLTEKFAVTEENAEQFALSEALYFRYLTTASAADSALAAKKNAELLNRAVETCTEAAQTGHPAAVARLGYYYDKGYAECGRSSADRFRIAYDYYASVCYCAQDTLEGTDGASGLGKENFDAIKRRAATLLLNMLPNAPAEFSGVPRFSFALQKRNLESKFGSLGVDAADGETPREGEAESVYRVLQSCFDRTRAPVFGVFTLTGAEIRELFDRPVPKRSKRVADLINNGLELRYMRFLDRNGEVQHYEVESAPVNLSVATYADALSALNAEREYCLYFFNGKGRHAYWNRRQLKRFGEELRGERKDYKRIVALANKGGRRYAFFDDDLVWAERKGGKRAVDRLIEEAIGYGESGEVSV